MVQEGSVLLAKIDRFARGLLTTVAATLARRRRRLDIAAESLSDYAESARRLLAHNRAFLRQPPCEAWERLRDLLLDLSTAIEATFLDWLGRTDAVSWSTAVADLRAMQESGFQLRGEVRALRRDGCTS